MLPRGRHQETKKQKVGQIKRLEMAANGCRLNAGGSGMFPCANALLSFLRIYIFIHFSLENIKPFLLFFLCHTHTCITQATPSTHTHTLPAYENRPFLLSETIGTLWVPECCQKFEMVEGGSRKEEKRGKRRLEHVQLGRFRPGPACST